MARGFQAGRGLFLNRVCRLEFRAILGADENLPAFWNWGAFFPTRWMVSRNHETPPPKRPSEMATELCLWWVRPGSGAVLGRRGGGVGDFRVGVSGFFRSGRDHLRGGWSGSLEDLVVVGADSFSRRPPDDPGGGCDLAPEESGAAFRGGALARFGRYGTLGRG